MYITSILAASALLAASSAQDVDTNDIPTPCRAVCNPVHDVTQQCDNSNQTDDDGPYIRCVCQGQNMNMLLPACEACVAQNGDSDNDVLDLVSSCSLGITTYTPSVYVTGAPATGTNGTSGSNATVITTTGSAGPMTITSTQPSNTGSGSGGQNGGGSRESAGGGDTGGSAASQSGNVAPVATGGALAGLGVLAVAAVGIL